MFFFFPVDVLGGWVEGGALGVEWRWISFKLTNNALCGDSATSVPGPQEHGKAGVVQLIAPRLN